MTQYSVEARTKTLEELLRNNHFYVDYYQRNYAWKPQQVSDLIDDLTGRFLESYRPSHARAEGTRYAPYFLGVMDFAHRDNKNYIIDGQQRLTTLTLLLFYLHNQQRVQGDDGDPDLSPLLLSSIRGVRTFNIRIDEYRSVFEKLIEGALPLVSGTDSYSTAALVERYQQIEEEFPEKCKGTALVAFIDWLLYKVEIGTLTTEDEGDAYQIFETQNNRGLSLTTGDLFRSYLLSSITDRSQREIAVQVCDESLLNLPRTRDVENRFFRTWIRGRYCQSVGTSADDFERIGPQFNRWFRERAYNLGYRDWHDFDRLVTSDLKFYARWFKVIRDASVSVDQNLLPVYLAANTPGETADQEMMWLAVLRPTDSEEECYVRIGLMTTFWDIFIGRRVWGQHGLRMPALKNFYVTYSRAVRNATTQELAARLYFELIRPGAESFSPEPPSYGLPSMNKKVRYLLARLTAFAEKESLLEQAREFERINTATGRDNKFDVEHVIPNSYDEYCEWFISPEDFAEQRNRLGALLLLPMSINRSYRDLPVGLKIPEYSRLDHNMLAGSLTSRVRNNLPKFDRLTRDLATPLPTYDNRQVFNAAAIDNRTAFYRHLAERMWNPERLLNYPGGSNYFDPTFVQEVASSAAQRITADMSRQEGQDVLEASLSEAINSAHS